MSEKPSRPKGSVKLNVETILQTSEGRSFLNQINQVGRVLAMKDSEVEFKGEEVAKTGFVSDCKSVQLFKCERGYFVFCNKTFSMNNWSTAGASIDVILNKISDEEIRAVLAEQLGQEAAPAS